MDIWSFPIYDMGLTQVPEKSFTCLVVEPYDEYSLNALFGDLKLL